MSRENVLENVVDMSTKNVNAALRYPRPAFPRCSVARKLGLRPLPASIRLPTRRIVAISGNGQCCEKSYPGNSDLQGSSQRCRLRHVKQYSLGFLHRVPELAYPSPWTELIVGMMVHNDTCTMLQKDVLRFREKCRVPSSSYHCHVRNPPCKLYTTVSNR